MFLTGAFAAERVVRHPVALSCSVPREIPSGSFDRSRIPEFQQIVHMGFEDLCKSANPARLLDVLDMIQDILPPDVLSPILLIKRTVS